MPHFSDLRNELSTFLDDEKITIIHTAYQLAAKAHKGQQRYSGDPYIIHPIAVAAILCQMHMDYQSIAAAILRCVIGDPLHQRAGTISDPGDGDSDSAHDANLPVFPLNSMRACPARCKQKIFVKWS